MKVGAKNDRYKFIGNAEIHYTVGVNPCQDFIIKFVPDDGKLLPVKILAGKF